VKKRDLVTPVTTTGSMDSDDDFLSDVSSAGDFLDTQNSDDESLGDGMLVLSVSVMTFFC
jgi:ariadne-1